MHMPVCYGTETTIDGHSQFAAPLASFYLHMLETAGPERPLLWEVLNNPWASSGKLLFHFHAQIFPSTLEGAWEYRLWFYVVCTLNGKPCTFPQVDHWDKRYLSLLSNMHTQNNTAVIQCLQCVGRWCLTPIQKTKKSPVKFSFYVPTLCHFAWVIPICKALQLLLVDCGGVGLTFSLLFHGCCQSKSSTTVTDCSTGGSKSPPNW